MSRITNELDGKIRAVEAKVRLLENHFDFGDVQDLKRTAEYLRKDVDYIQRTLAGLCAYVGIDQHSLQGTKTNG
jgi:hypothetical protein